MNGDDREERLPPQNQDVERCVLGGALLDTTAARLAVEALGRDDFYATKHGDIFQAIANVSKAGDVPDEMTVAEELRERKHLVQAGGTEYIHELALFAGNKSSPLNMERFLRVLQKYSAARTMQAAGTGFLRNLNEGMDPDEARGHLETWLRGTGKAGRDELSIGEVLTMAKPVLPVFDCGLEAIRKGPGGLYEGLNLFSGPPGAGKTTLALQLVARAVTCGHSVHIFSSDQSRDALARKIWAHRSNLPWKTIVEGEALEEVKNWPVVFDIRPMELDRILSRMRDKQMRGVKWFLIDYLQLVHLSGKGEVWAKAGVVATEIKRLADELNVIVLLIGRDTKGEKGEGPGMRRVAGDRAVMNAADQAWVITRATEKKSKITVVKNRMDRLGEFFLGFDGAKGRFCDMEGEPSYGSSSDASSSDGSGTHPF